MPHLIVFCAQNADRLDSEIIYDRDFDYDYFGFKVHKDTTLASTRQGIIHAGSY